MIASSAETRLDFIGDAKAAVLAYNRVRLLQIIRRTVSRSANSLNRLHDERGDRARRSESNELFEIGDTLRCNLFGRSGETTAIRIGTNGVMHATRNVDRILPGAV